jgi:hypothetical protein
MALSMGSSVTVNFSTVTTVASAARPQGLLHSIANAVVSVSGAEVCDPEVGSVPDKPDTPRQVVALCDDQVRRTVPFGGTVVRSAVMDAPGGYHTRTVTLAVATPPRPEHEIEYVAVPPTTTFWNPEVPSGPNHAPDAAQEDA